MLFSLLFIASCCCKCPDEFRHAVTGLSEGESFWERSDDELSDEEELLSEEVELHREVALDWSWLLALDLRK